MKNTLIAVLVLMVVLVLGFAAGQCFAQTVAEDKPLLSAERLHVGVQVRYAWWRSAGAPLPTGFEKEWEVSAPVVYNLNTFDIVYAPTYLTDNRLMRHSLGINFELPVFGGKP